MAKATLDDLSNIFTAATTINSNNAKIEVALENTLSRDGTSPNEMNAVLDMNNNRIINLPEPTAATDPVRLQDLTSAELNLGLSASDIDNDSFVAGVTVKDALENIVAGNLADSDGIPNASGVVGATVSDALDTLDAAIGSIDTDIAAIVGDVVDARNTDPDISLSASLVVDLYVPADAAGRATHAWRSAHTSDLIGKERYTAFVGNYDSGTGDGTVPASTYGLGISTLKDDWTVTTREGQAHGLSIVTRGGYHGVFGGPDFYNPGDTAAIVTNTIVSSTQSFAAAVEGVAGWADFGSFVPGSVKLIRYQIGGVCHDKDIGHGYLASAENGTLTSAFLASNKLGGAAGDGYWTDAFLYAPDLGDGYYNAVRINQSGWLVFENGPAAFVPNQGKTIRIGGSGNLEILNSAKDTVIANVNNSGKLTVAQSVKLTPLSSPPAAEQGVIYQRASDGKLAICEDGVNWRIISTVAA